MYRPNACILAYRDWGTLLQSHLLARDWRREYMAARRGMLSERLRNEHSRALQLWEARPLCNQPHHHLYRAASRCWAKPELCTHPAPGKTRAGNTLEHSSVGGVAGVSGQGDKELPGQLLHEGAHCHVHTCTCHGRKLCSERALLRLYMEARKNIETRQRSVPELEDNKGLPKNSIIVILAGSGPPSLLAISFLSNLGHMGQVTMT
ncbi:hypothetical protein mRhiFer1_008282 [Rhinolophus ferrumequinum]|uniref:Uncharacterized protein n=1 Tax=Rhinolophus ferrumequinum TaxID=59479 RepID=A0A7J7VQR2_RHIFE|nr:hypothetical protein mRhiFer1_008282 [Rhinolophus ferrumequinum]